jgi:hypothetical protein
MPQVNASLLMKLAFFEIFFVTLFGMYVANTCNFHVAEPNIQPMQVSSCSSGFTCSVTHFFSSVVSTIKSIAHAMSYFLTVLTGLNLVGANCGFPTWFVSFFQIPILLGIVYLIIELVWF